MISIVVTVRNEVHTVARLLESILLQTVLPEEVVFVDAFSGDDTLSVLKDYRRSFKSKGINLKVIQKKGNRSIGRNAGIQAASGKIILVTDAGCTLHKDWVKHMKKGFSDPNVDIVSGYYLPGKKASAFQKCLATYTCVMPNRLDEKKYLPSSRSLGFRKHIWKKIGGYPEELSYAEDLVFARKLKNSGYMMKLAKEAIVYWPQRKNIAEAYRQFYEYALGDGQAQYFRKNAWFLFGRYLVGVLILTVYLLTMDIGVLILLCGLVVSYVVWSVFKNYAYVKDIKALLYLPVLQFTADVAVMVGNILGVLKGSRLFTLVGYQIAAKVVASVLSLIATGLLTRHLGVTGFSQYSLIFSIATFAFLFADFGMDTYVVRASAKKYSQSFVNSALTLRVFLSVIVFTLLNLGMHFTSFSSTIKLGVFIASFSGLFLLTSSLLWAVLKGKLEYKKVAVIQIVTSLIILALVGYGVVNKFSFFYFVSAHAVGFFAGLIVTLACWDSPRVSITSVSRHTIGLLRKVMPFSVLFLLGVIYFKVDMLILGTYFKPELSPDVGYYALAYKPFEIVVLLGNYYTQTLLPYFVTYRLKDTKKYLKFTVFLSLAMGIGIFLFAKPFVYIMGGNEYAPAVSSMLILSLAAIFTLIAGYYNSLYIALNKEKLIIKLYALAAVVNVVGNLLVIPKYSYIGASWVTVATQAFLLIAFLFWSKRIERGTI